MTFDYAAKARSADRMIRAYGSTGTLSSTASTYDPATGTTADTTTTQTVQMVAFDYPHHYVDGTLIRQGDKQAFISAVGLTAPKVGNKLTWGDVVHAVVSVKPLSPALTAVLYEAQLRT